MFEGKVSSSPLFPSADLSSRRFGRSCQIVDEQLRLIAFQQSLEKEVNGSRTFVGLSVNDTIRACIEGGYPKKADKIKTDFKVPDKR